MITAWLPLLGDVDGFGHMNGWGWMGLGWLITLSLVVLVTWAVVPRERRRHTAEEILDERFARGELTPEEYRERKATLQE